MSDRKVLAKLRAELGDALDTTDASLEAARADKSGHASTGRPLAVVHAQSVEDVQATLRIASATGTPVVTRGAGTGLAGGANAGPGEIALSVRAMDRILEVRPDDLLAVVEPGILNAELNRALAEHGLWWAPDPASRDISTVGGNIAAGAGGLLCAKYGVVRDAVLGVDLVLADGRLLHLGHRTVKGVTGLDLTSLVIGSEDDPYAVSAKDFVLRAGQPYRWDIVSKGGVEYKWHAPDFFRNVWNNQIVIADREIHMDGSPAWLEFDAQGPITVQFQTVRPGRYDWYVEGLEDEGMKGTITIVP